MDQEQAMDYATVKAAIFDRYEITEEMYHQQFRKSKRNESKIYTELVTCLANSARRWMSTVGYSSTGAVYQHPRASSGEGTEACHECRCRQACRRLRAGKEI